MMKKIKYYKTWKMKKLLKKIWLPIHVTLINICSLLFYTLWVCFECTSRPNISYVCPFMSDRKLSACRFFHLAHSQCIQKYTYSNPCTCCYRQNKSSLKPQPEVVWLCGGGGTSAITHLGAGNCVHKGTGSREAPVTSCLHLWSGELHILLLRRRAAMPRAPVAST